jgi:hypothetical protein
MPVEPAVITALWKWDAGCPRIAPFDYTLEHAHRWIAGVRRHMSIPHRVILLLDDYWLEVVEEAGEFDDGVELVRIDPVLCVGGMSANMQPYHPRLNVQQGMFAGLDTIFVGDITDIVTWDKAPIGLPVDPRVPSRVCNAVNVFTREGGDLIWETYEKNLLDQRPDIYDRRWFRRFGLKKYWRFADMNLIRWLWERRRKWPHLETEFPGRIVSYQCDIETGRAPLEQASVVYLHGNPRIGTLPAGDPVQKEWLRDG